MFYCCFNIDGLHSIRYPMMWINCTHTVRLTKKGKKYQQRKNTKYSMNEMWFKTEWLKKCERCFFCVSILRLRECFFMCVRACVSFSKSKRSYSLARSFFFLRQLWIFLRRPSTWFSWFCLSVFFFAFPFSTNVQTK